MTVDLSRTVEHNGDILEWVCMTSPAGCLSWTDVIRNLNTLSKDEATTTYGEPLTWRESNIEPVQSDTEFFENTLDKWIEILSDRDQACGPNNAYPFEITRDGLTFHKCSSPAYQFQLLVSLNNLSKGDVCADEVPVHKFFEELSAAAAGQYFGDSKTSIVFGFPRSSLPRDFRDAVNHLVKLLREGRGCKDRQGLQKLKDDKLDIVAWREFPDQKASKLILFGQCATGRHWDQKVYELQPETWCKMNFVEVLAVNPIPAFFVPRTLSEEDAGKAGSGQISLDRCRISALCSGTLNDQLKERLWSWIRTTLRNNGQEHTN